MKKLVDYEEIKESLNNSLLEANKYINKFADENTKRVKSYIYLDRCDSSFLDWLSKDCPKKYKKLVKNGKLFSGYVDDFKNKKSKVTWLHLSAQYRFMELAIQNLLDKYKDKVITVPDNYSHAIENVMLPSIDDMSYIDINCSDKIASKVVTRTLPDNDTIISITCTENLQDRQANVTYNYILNSRQ